MGSLDRCQGSVCKKKIAVIDVSAYTPSQFQDYYNNNYGDKGWSIIQFVTINTSRYIIAEKEI